MVQPECRYRNHNRHCKIAVSTLAVALQFSALHRIFPAAAGVVQVTDLVAVRRGFTLTEVATVCTLVGLATMIALPRTMRMLDWIVVDRAAREITLALAIARHTAVAQGGRVRVGIAADSIRLDRWDGRTWRPGHRWPGPAFHGVTLAASNPAVVYGPHGIGWSASNSRFVLLLRSQTATITVSRVGRVKRW